MCWGITKSFLKKSGGIRPWIAPLSINHSPVTIHTLHPHTPLPTLSLPIRSAVSQTPPAPASHRKEADQREKPTVSQKGNTCRTAQPHTEMFQQALSWLQPPELLCPLQDTGHSLCPLLGWAALQNLQGLTLFWDMRRQPKSRGTCKLSVWLVQLWGWKQNSPPTHFQTFLPGLLWAGGSVLIPACSFVGPV